MAINPELIRLNRYIDKLLAEERPERYVVRDSDIDRGELDPEEVAGTAWLDAVATRAESLVPAAEIRHYLARIIVGKREGIATQHVNNMCRKAAQIGKLPQGWFDWRDHPVAITTRIIKPSRRPKVIQERVAFRAITANDCDLFEREERRRAAHDNAARNSACDGFVMLGELLLFHGVVDTRALYDLGVV